MRRSLQLNIWRMLRRRVAAFPSRTARLKGLNRSGPGSMRGDDASAAPNRSSHPWMKRVNAGVAEQPNACAAAGHNAIVFGDLKDPESSLSKALEALPSRQIREDLALNTGVRYSGV